MNTSLIYFALFITQVVIYFYFKNSLKNVLFLHKTNNSILINTIDEKIESEVNKLPELVVLTSEVEDNNYVILNKSLKHLEFISKFEMYLEDKNYKKFPIEFLQEFEKIKHEAQLTILKTTDRIANEKYMLAS